MIPNCPDLKCTSQSSRDPKPASVVRNGSYLRRSDSRRITRYFCKNCGSYYSRATLDPRFRQKKRRINPELSRLLSSAVSLRRAAILLRVNRKTVVRRVHFLAEQARINQASFMDQRFRERPVESVQFDELETIEHTKLKPVSVALAVEPSTRKILNFQVSQMSANGPLAEKSRRKYGKRIDHRGRGLSRMMREMLRYVAKDAIWISDENPRYPAHLKKYYPEATHIQIKGGRGSSGGQGELKRLRYDPIFALNHTCAMLRANLNRLIRRTWCTTKRIRGLLDHLSIYVAYHNRVLTELSAGKGAS